MGKDGSSKKKMCFFASFCKNGRITSLFDNKQVKFNVKG